MQFYNPVDLIFGIGVRKKLIEQCLDKTVLLVSSKSALERYSNDPIMGEFFSIPNLLLESNFDSNPSLTDIEKLSSMHKDTSIDVVIGLGGGSAMDVAKIASNFIPASKVGFCIDDLLNRPQIINQINSLDCYQIPTTAGTGSEVTPFSTIWDYKKNLKKSLSHPKLFAKKAFIDPDFLIGIPFEVAISTGLDALNQAFESLWNKNANFYTRLLSREAIKLSLLAFPVIKEVSNRPDVREKLSLASLFAGLAISKTRTSICHSISYPLTLSYGIPHGIACAFSMLEVYKFNSDFIKEDIEEIERSLNLNLYETLKKICDDNNLNDYLVKALPDPSTFTKSLDDFITAGRFENNIKECNHNDLLKIIIDSYERLVFKI